jgi:hypothetical protein
MPEPEVVSALCLQHGRFLKTLFPQVAQVLRSVSQTNWLIVSNSLISLYAVVIGVESGCI